MNKNQLIKVVVFSLAFICLCVVAGEVWAIQALDEDSVELVVEYTTAYPGHFAEISVLLKNPNVEISSFKIQFTLGGWNLINFHTVNIYTDSVKVPLDTCPENPDTICTVDTCYCGPDLPDTCACLVWHYFKVRECHIDTVGSLISDFQTVTCHGDLGDTISDSCRWVTVYASAGRDAEGAAKFIAPNPNWRLLFKLGVDLFCMCDVDTGRSVFFLVSPGFSDFSDTMGNSVPFEYHIGELFAWWGLPGDASNDSVASVTDIVFLINYLFSGKGPPCIWEAADPDSSCTVGVTDIVYLINYLFNETSPPKRGCACPGFLRIRKLDTDFEFSETLNPKLLLERR